MGGKRGVTIGARFNDEELRRWEIVMERVQKRNALAKTSDVLRDLLFGGLNLVTDEDRAILRGEALENSTVPVFAANVAQDRAPYSASKKKSRK